MFTSLGKKFLDPNYKDDGNKKEEEKEKEKQENINEAINQDINEQNQEEKKEEKKENPKPKIGEDEPRKQSIKLDPKKIKEKKKKKKFC